jgi:hypothetical protein
MHLRLTSHWIGSCEPISHHNHLSTSILASGLHFCKHRICEYINCMSSVSQLPVVGLKSLRKCRIEYGPNTSLHCSLQALFGGIWTSTNVLGYSGSIYAMSSLSNFHASEALSWSLSAWYINQSFQLICKWMFTQHRWYVEQQTIALSLLFGNNSCCRETSEIELTCCVCVRSPVFWRWLFKANAWSSMVAYQSLEGSYSELS